jgi:WD40 repeat protein/serine/threonine protein kinase
LKDLKAIYFTSRGLPPPRRAAFLDQACEGEPALRARVEQMLAVSDEAEAFITDLPDDKPEGRKFGRGPSEVALKEPIDETVGQKIGRYKILEAVGEGGCGVVYVAEQTEPVRRRVALKIIKLGMDTKQVVARFEAERQALAMMDHPNIARVLDAGATESGRPYFIMELVRGIKITDYCDQNNLPTKERLDLFIKVCLAIQHAHQKGIIHRDIKPSNILVTLNDSLPVPKVIDFGIAKATEGRLTDATVYTQLHQFIGTPAYMSPEQAEMSSLDVDTRSDIYSLGVLLYELLSGRTPFDAQELMSQGIDAMRKTIREKQPVKPSTRLATLQGIELTTAAKRRAVEGPRLIHLLKGDLDWIVMKCLEKDRTRRYETANGLATDLKRHLNNEPVLACPPSKLYEFQKTVRRHKFGFVAAAMVVATLVAGLLGTSIGLGRANRARIQAGQNAERANQLAEEAKKAEASALGLAYSASMLSACDAVQNAQIDAVRHYLDIAPRELRGWEWRLLSNRLDLSLRVQERSRLLGINSQHSSRIHVLPDGHSYYDVGPTNIQRWDMATGRLLATIPTDHTCWDSWLVADGKRMLLKVSDSPGAPQNLEWTFELWDLERGSLLFAWPDQGEACPAPDGSRVATRQVSKISIMDLSEGLPQLSRTTAAQFATSWSMCFQPDGRRLAVCKGVGDVALLDTDSLEVLSTFPAHDNGIMCMAFSADSRLLATGSMDSTIRITDVSADLPVAVATLRGHTDWIKGLSFSPDGSLLASSGGDRTLRLWDTRTGICLGVFKSDGDCPCFLPDGRTLINGDSDGVRFWDVKSLDAWVLRGHRSYVCCIFISPDGGTIYSGGWDGFAGQPGSLRFWDALTGDPIGALGAAGEYVRAAALSSDGSRLAVSMVPQSGASGRIDILDTATATTTATVTEAGAALGSAFADSLAFDPSGQNLVYVDRLGIVHRIDARTGVTRKAQRVASANLKDNHSDNFVAWSPDGATIAVCLKMGSTIALLNGQSLEPLRQWPHGHKGLVNSVAFSPDSQRILTTGDDGMVRVWDAATGAQLHDLLGRVNRALCAGYSPDGQRIASGGFDDNVRIWNAQTFEQVAQLGGHQEYVHSLAWRADSQQLLSCSGDHTVRIWDTQSLKDRVQARCERQTILADVEPMVQRLFAELGDAGKVAERVKADVSLSTRARQIALQVALRMSLDRINAATRQPHGSRSVN